MLKKYWRSSGLKALRNNARHCLQMALVVTLGPAIMMVAFTIQNFKQVGKIQVKAESLEVDRLGHVYSINGYQLVKYNKNGTQLHTYSNFIAGDISSVDASDPFKILVYYKDFGQIDILDNTLSPAAQPILLQSYGLELSTLICRSYNNGIWIYEPTNFEIVRLDQNMQLAERTGNINQVTGYEINPNFMVETDNNLYINDPQTGIIVFDRYGTYFRTIPYTGIQSFQVHDSRISFFDGNKLSIYDTRKLLTSEIASGLSGVKDIRIAFDMKPQMLYLLDGKLIQIFENNR